MFNISSQPHPLMVILWYCGQEVNINKEWKEIFFVNANKKTSYLNVRKIINDLGIKIEFKIINVIGTNGKGLVANYLSEGLIKNKYKVGLFTSPHLILSTERIKVNNKNIDQKTFWTIKKKLFNLNFFEIFYLVALIYFAHKKIDVAIIEAGIGGNKDTTKAVQGQVGIVTSIGLDHQELLGDTLEKIAVDKAGIIHSNMNFYIPNTLSQNVQNIFKLQAQNYFMVDNKAKNFIQENMILATTVLKKEFNINYQNFTKIPGRVDIKMINHKKYIFDVAHNFDGIKATLRYLKNQNITFSNVVICMQKKKRTEGIIELFKTKKVFYFQLNNNFHQFKNISKIEFNDFEKLIGSTLFIGSFYFIGYLYEKNNF